LTFCSAVTFEEKSRLPTAHQLRPGYNKSLRDPYNGSAMTLGDTSRRKLSVLSSQADIPST
jgi:hypothetical protein